MHWLQAVDVGLLHFINQTLRNAFFDVLMPFASGNQWFFPVVLLLGLWFLWRGGARGRLCVLMLALLVPIGDGLVCNTLKHAVARPRPFVTHAEVIVFGKQNTKFIPPVMDTDSEANRDNPTSRPPNHNSMPSAHAMNCFTAAMICFLYYRRSWRFTLPLACLVAFSRVYNGVHYPSDVLAGAILGAGYAVAGIWAINSLWRWAGHKWFPLWWQKLPSLVDPNTNIEHRTSNIEHPITTDLHWLRLGYLIIAAVFLARLAYLASGTILLSEDEAYQWLWSKHLAWSYYSKPLGIAVAQWIGTAMWGDTAFGIRFLSPVLAAALGVVLLRFVARQTDGRTGFLFVLICHATPLLCAGSVLMTVDPLVVFFWTLAMLAAWQAITRDSTAWWAAAGLGMGGAFLSKYFSPFQWASFALFFALCRPARVQLRRPGPWLALGLNLLCALPVVVWNQQHGWITLTHLKERGDVNGTWQFFLKYFGEFVGAEFGLLNFVFVVAVLWAMVGFVRKDLKPRHAFAEGGRDASSLPSGPTFAATPHPNTGRRGAAATLPPPALELFLFCQGIVVLGFYTLDSFRSRIQLNWIAACVTPLLLFATLWWHRRWLAGDRKPAWFVALGLALGLPIAVLSHNTDWIRNPLQWLANLTQRDAGRLDPLHRLRGHDQVARLVGEHRAELLKEGKPVFIIADHYGRAGLLNFYLPEARPLVRGDALVTMHRPAQPKSQLWFWPGYTYESRTGLNAIYICETDDRLPAPSWLKADFESITDLGMFDIEHQGRNYNRIQLFACRGKR